VPEAQVTRVGVRYINQLDLPSTMRDFNDYIRTYPQVSSDLPQALAGFFSQVQIPLPDIEAMLLVTVTTVPPPSVNVASVVLDIDVFKENLKPMPDSKIWESLDVLRRRKNLAFEACITNNTRELIS
jgi:uncharacterized protein (TIGR04255 family)